MARKTQAQAEARQRKQKIIAGVGGVILVALLAIQGPKLMKQLNPPAPKATASTTSSSAGTPTARSTSGAVTSTPVARAVKAPKSQTAQLAGVVIVPEQPVAAGQGQLDSFSRFTSKDPFVQQVKKEGLPTPAQVAGNAAPQATQTPSAPKPVAAKPTPTGTGTLAGTGIVTVGTGTALTQPAATKALLRVNGKFQVVELKKRFPASDKAFVLRALKRSSATIGVAGGTFAGGEGTLTLRLGRAVTLVNTATGVRYVVRLVYVGADAAQVTGFSTPK